MNFTNLKTVTSQFYKYISFENTLIFDNDDLEPKEIVKCLFRKEVGSKWYIP